MPVSNRFRWVVGSESATWGPPGAFPVATFAVNVLGCLVIGALLVVLTEVVTAHPLARPFLATGVLGGFTTFSAFSLDAALMWQRGDHTACALYVAGSVALSIAALFAGGWIARMAMS